MIRKKDIQNPFRDWSVLKTFQVEIANKWLEKGNKIEDIFAKFFFYFAGFNSIYFLWRKIDNLSICENKHIENLLKKFGDEKLKKILDKSKENINFFIKREPIQRMKERNKNNQYEGCKSEGRGFKEILKNKDIDASEKIIALGGILYLIRSNLVHGSKFHYLDDEEIIKYSVSPLKILLEESISLTNELFGDVY